MNIPVDNEVMTKKYLEDGGGCCGQACLAVIENRPIGNVFSDWTKLGLEWRGWSGWKQLREYLEKKKYAVKQLRKDSWGDFEKEDFVIARVQWLGSNIEKLEKPFYGYNHWSEASAHTHFIVIHNNEFFCNETGIFKDLDDYLDGKGINQSGVITSLMRIRNYSHFHGKVTK
jgi:hypothetical protein